MIKMEIWDDFSCPSVFAMGNEIAWNKDGQHAVLQMLVSWYAHHFSPLTVLALTDVLSCSAAYRISRKAVQSMRKERFHEVASKAVISFGRPACLSRPHFSWDCQQTCCMCDTYVWTAMVNLKMLCTQFGPVLAKWFLHFVMQEIGAEVIFGPLPQTL